MWVRSKTARTALVFVLMLAFAAVARADITAFSTNVLNNIIRVSYTWTAPNPAAQLVVNFTSTTNPADYILLGFSSDTQSTSSGTVTIDPRNPVNSSCSFCVVTRNGGSLFSFPNSQYSAQLSFLTTSGTTATSTTATFSVAVYTMPAIVSLPVNGTNFSSIVNFRVVYPQPVALRTANISCVDPNGATTDIFLVNPGANTPITVNVSTLPLSAVSSVSFTNQTALTTWVEGYHTCTFPFASSSRLPVYGVTAVTFRIKRVTVAPTVLSPVGGAFYTTRNQIRLVYQLGEQPLPGSVNITLFPASGAAITFVQSDNFVGQQNVSLASAPDGTYTATFCYRDVLANPPACVNIGSAFTVKQNTGAVTLSISSQRKGRSFPISYSMAETAGLNTAKLTFVSLPSLTTALTVTVDPTVLSVSSVTMNAFDLASNSFVVSSTATSIPDGTYNIVFSAQDVYLNPEATATVTSITFRNATLPATLVEPAAGTVRNTLAIQYQLLDDPASFPVLTLANSQFLIRLSLSTEVPPSVTFLRVSSAAELTQLPVVSFTTTAPGPQPIPDGTYDAWLTYSNGLTGDPSFSTANQSITIDTTSNPAVITAPTANARTRILQVNYTLSEAASAVVVSISDSVTGAAIVSMNMLNAFKVAGAHSFPFPSAGILPYSIINGSNSLADGKYIVSLNVTDFLANPGNVTSAGPVEIRSSTLAPVIYSPVPGPTRILDFNLGLTDDAAAGSATVTISGFSSNFAFVSAVLVLDTTTAGNKTFSWDGLSNPVSPGVVSSWNGAIVPDGPSYTVVFSYSDTFGNPASSDTVTSVFVRTSTPQPAITTPGPFSSSTAPFSLSYLLQATPLTNSTYLNFTYTAPVDVAGAAYVGNVYTFILDPPGAARSTYPRTFSLSWATNANPLLASGFNPLTNLPNGIPDGTYDIKIVTRDSLGNGPASSTVSSVLLQTATPAPTLFFPATNSHMITSQALNFRLPSATTGSATLNVTGYTLSSRYTCLVQMLLPFVTDSLTGLQNATTPFDPLSSAVASKVMSLSPAPCPSTFSSLPNGRYSFTLSYRDFLNNPTASATSTGVTLNWKTEPAVVVAPVSGSVFSTSGSTPVSVNFTLLSTPRAGSVVVAFTPVPSGNPPTITGKSLQLLIADSQITVGQPVAFSFSPSAAVSSPFVAQQAPASNTPLTTGAYTVTVTYQDVELAASAASTTTVTNVFVSPNTEPPSIFSPVAGDEKGAQIDVQYRIPSNALEGSIQINFTLGSSVFTVNVAGTQFGTYTLSLNKITGTASISPSDQTISSTSAAVTSLADGTYSISLRYRDQLGNPPASTSVSGVTISTAAKVPVIYSPSAGAVVTSAAPLNITFIIPSGAKVSAGSLIVTLTCTAPNTVSACPTSPITLTLVDPTSIGTPISLIWYTRTDVSSLPQVASASVRTLLDGTYTISISYQDSVALQPGTSVPVTGVLVDAVTQTPSLFTPSSNDYYGATVVVSYRLPDSTNTDPILVLRSRVASVPSLNITLQADATGKTVFFSWPYRTFPYPSQINATVPANKMLDGGRYDVLLVYQDAYNNPVATSTLATDVFVDPTGSPIYRVSLTVGVDYDTLPSDFSSQFVSQVASALGTLASQFKVQSVTRVLPANFPVVTMDILPRFEELQFASTDVMNALQNQFNNPSSTLRLSGSFTTQIQAAAGLTQTQICLNEQQVIIGCPVAPSSSSSDTTKWILVGLGAGLAAVVIVLAVLLHYFDKRRKNAEKKAQDEEAEIQKQKRHTADEAKRADEEHNRFVSEHEARERLEKERGGVPLSAFPSSSSLAAKPDVRETNISITLSPSGGLAPASNTTSATQPLMD